MNVVSRLRGRWKSPTRLGLYSLLDMSPKNTFLLHVISVYQKFRRFGRHVCALDLFWCNAMVKRDCWEKFSEGTTLQLFVRNITREIFLGARSQAHPQTSSRIWEPFLRFRVLSNENTKVSQNISPLVCCLWATRSLIMWGWPLPRYYRFKSTFRARIQLQLAGVRLNSEDLLLHLQRAHLEKRMSSSQYDIHFSLQSCPKCMHQ
jgi:hypothetical protein